LKDYKRSEGV